ncbi:alpha/beta fold hydrolase [Rhodopila sp.]|uniref:alpha/beta fold hydrolase n=1 Tax=Rhodopila sp. TaxID=2480087 RepID=UPI003D12AADD
MVPGTGIRGTDFQAKGLIAAVDQQNWPMAIATVDPGLDAYLDGSVAARLLDGINQARHAAGASRVWLGGISLGCQGILRCVRARPGLADGLMLLTPYLASTGLIAEVVRAGGLRRWAATNPAQQPDRALLMWLATTPPSELPPILLGHALQDRFATTTAVMAEMLPDGRVVSVAGAHDWQSWQLLWRLMLQRNPFATPAAYVR